ncbi:MFS transporter [Streptomyces sp. NBC_00117]|uniref:MFS transporter n=1 Tax=unclassified Streptomyces TaxID=2593676 RepID=UPI002252C067|nr:MULTISPECIES: MFS transporter [unclassified Streptomyces]MCX5435596.1 MFS transporter [Streptomyces sp. NBC_00063]WSE08871.1 MFS transporter [Streptomyces sp. NBC_01445]
MAVFPGVAPSATPPESAPTAAAAPAPGPAPANASGKLVFGLAFAQFGVMATLLTPVMVTLALRVAQIVPEGDRGAALGQVLSLGAVLAMIANPVMGGLSDRTTSRFGRRRPWLLGGVLAAFAGLVVVALGGNVPTLMLGWALAQIGGNAALTAVTASIPDFVPEHQRARVSGMVGMTTSLSMIAGSGLANAFSTHLALAFLGPGLLGIAGVITLCAVMKDRPARLGAFAPYSFKEFLRSFWVSPRKHPDFVWNFAGRFLVFVGISCVTSYQAYFLMDRLGYDDDQVANKLFVGILVMVVTVVAGSVIGGQLSDRSGRRKPYVLGSSMIIAAGLALLAFAHSFPVFLLALAVFGFGEGLYLSVDVALAAAVLPDPEQAARDMGVLNIGNALPQSLVPIVAPALLALGGGGNYGALFLFGGIACVLGAFAVQFIRSVK